MMTVSPGVLADQTEYASCLGDRTGSTTNFSYNYWYYGTFYSNNLALPGNYNLTCRPPQGLIVNPGSPPTQPTETPTCTTNILPEDGAGTYYALYRSTNDATGEYCLYSLESDGTNWVSAQLVSAASTPTSSARNIPLLGPLGLIGLLTGLLWFGRKRIH